MGSSTLNLNDSVNIGICGASGIGSVHARILSSISGVKISSILGRTQQSVEKTAKKLEESFGIHVKSYCQLDSLIKQEKPDIIFICTPPELHYSQIISCLDNEIAVFCEKPFFWYNDINLKNIEKKFKKIQNHKNRFIFVNTCNEYFIERIIEETKLNKVIKSFYFSFYTKGNSSGNDIGIDLLPHGLSLLLRLNGKKNISNIRKFVKKHTYCCQFNYGDCTVEFDFQENNKGSKEMKFRINDRQFTRVQRGSMETYKVYLKDNKNSDLIELQDPFQVFIKKFLNTYKNNIINNEKICDGFDMAASNMRLMTEILLQN